MRKVLLFALGCAVCFPAVGHCEGPKSPESKPISTPATPSPKEEDVIREEWNRITNDTKRPQYSPSSVSVEEKVAEDKPLMVRDRSRNIDEKSNAMDTKLPEVADLPKEFDKIVSFKGKTKLSQVIRTLSKEVGRNLIVGAGVQDQEIDVDMDKIEIWRAFNTVLFPVGYAFKLNGDKDIVILAQETRMFRLNLPPFMQKLESVTTNESLEGSGGSSQGGDSSSSSSSSNSSNGNNSSSGRLRVGTKVVVENTVEGLSFWNDVDANIRRLVSTTGQFSLNKVGGVVVVTDNPVSLDKIGVYLSELNKRVSQQILCDVKVIEVRMTNERQMGVDWAALAKDTRYGLSTNFATQNITDGSWMVFTGKSARAGAGTTADGVSAVIRALETYGKVEIVSQPKIVLLNNIVGNVQVGETKSYVDSTSVETTDSGTIVTGTLSEVHGGVTLQLLANVVGDEFFLSVTPVVSTIDNIRTINLGTSGKLEAPDTSLRSISTVVKVKEGQTVAIGGLISRDKTKTTSGIPVLSRIPGLGKLFSFDVNNNDRTELVVFITPRRG